VSIVIVSIFFPQTGIVAEGRRSSTPSPVAQDMDMVFGDNSTPVVQDHLLGVEQEILEPWTDKEGQPFFNIFPASAKKFY